MIYDYIIIGTGVAGLSAANYIPENKKVLLVCKKAPWECNSFWAQGGVATAVDENDIPSHISDTIEAGAKLNDIEAVEKLSKTSLETIKDLIAKGFEFDNIKKAVDKLYSFKGNHEYDRGILACIGGDQIFIVAERKLDWSDEE